MANRTQVSIRGLYKIFGSNPDAALPQVLAGMGKEELLQEYDHVLGLKDVNVDMQAGEITVVMGLSGSGKSTLIRHVNRLIEPTAGEIDIDGNNILGLSATELLRFRQTMMSMVFQKFALFPHRTVLQNAAMALEVRGEDISKREAEAHKWLERVGLGGYQNHYPYQLSGGMQQRVGIARALTSNSDIMLMDEAFSALDPLIRTDMQNLLLELQTELHKTIIFITHDLDEALKLADHLVILKDGAVVQQGEPQDILLNPADPYIEDFVGDINRARVLRVRSIMHPGEDGDHIAGDVDQNATLESVIELSAGNTQKNYRVCADGVPVGFLDMKELVKALVPARTNASRSRAAR